MSTLSMGVIVRLIEMVACKLNSQRPKIRERMSGIMGGQVLDLDVLRIKHEEEEKRRVLEEKYARIAEENDKEKTQMAEEIKSLRKELADLRATMA